ncbi:ATP-binding protein [Acidovorax sp. SUPP3334]|uniref:ATP-binding protein n=1 Tax=Acidovorax sp. SUPP3334 TaxID=2920881 RepID=UPI0023DE469F|nr:ATP-binding protein [Acidovorax sp. SUPP3334]GKT21089.1 hypothetical protein AVHM3334_03520 [Acidovorax sp. SUPP3334]
MKKISETSAFLEIANQVQMKLGGIGLDHHRKERPDGDYIIFEATAPSPFIFNAVADINKALDDDNHYKDRLVVSKRKSKPTSRLALPEVKLFRREVSESLTVDQNTFGDDFLERYTPSVSNLEELVVSNANCIVYGRRGAGKSSLLGYAMHQVKRSGNRHCWVAMQTFNGRKDPQVLASVLSEIVNAIGLVGGNATEAESLRSSLDTIGEGDLSKTQVREKISRLTPRIRRLVSSIASPQKTFTIFIDDLHLLAFDLQPEFLSGIYAIARGNSTYIKASGIEQLSNPWDSAKNLGFQAPHDAQTLKLDYNLTMPHKSLEHIEGILDAHAKFCGLPNIRYLIEDAALSRLILVAAAVPRDALSLFSQGISKALIKGQKNITVTAINAAAAEASQTKMQEIQNDLPTDDNTIHSLLEKVKNFCIIEKRTNSFLLKINPSDRNFETMQKLVALRLIHTLHEGITRSRAGEGYQALMLDFGFYVGIRAARSVKIFPSDLSQLLAKDLRRLPVFESSI